jgi:hypothetical protein
MHDVLFARLAPCGRVMGNTTHRRVIDPSLLERDLRLLRVWLSLPLRMRPRTWGPLSGSSVVRITHGVILLDDGHHCGWWGVGHAQREVVVRERKKILTLTLAGQPFG